MLGAWCLVLAAWCLVLGACCLVLGAWCRLPAACCLVLGAWCLVLAAAAPSTADCLGRLLGSCRLTEVDPEGRFQWCFLTDALRTLVFEDSLKPSGSYVMDQINKAVLLDCRRRVAHQVYVPKQHESGRATLVASYQRTAHDLAPAAAARMPSTGGGEGASTNPFL